MKGNRVAAFLAAYEECGNLTLAAKQAKIRREMHYRRMKADAKYKAAFEEADQRFGDRLEAHARQLCMEGVTEPIFRESTELIEGVGPVTVYKVVGHKLRYPQQLIMMLLKAQKPEKYNRDRIEHTGPNGGPIENELRVTFVE